jgi:hypothetical protein
MTVKLIPGVRAEQTPLLLQTGITQSNNIRWRDGLAEKIGGWKKFYNAAIAGPVRELWTWADLDGANHLAAAGGNNVNVITGTSLSPVGPLAATRHPSGLATTAGSPLVVVTDTGSNASTYESVTLQTPYAISGAGGFVIYPGSYPIVAVADGSHYTINIGQNATLTASTGTLCTISSTLGSATFTVALPNHNLAVGASFSIILPTAVGGVVLSGFYTVASVVDSGHFTIMGPNQAVSAQTSNYGNLSTTQLIQWVVKSQQPPPTLTAIAAFASGYAGIMMPPNPGNITPGMTVYDETTNQTLGIVQSYGPLTASQTLTNGFASGATSINMAPNTNTLGVIPGMTATIRSSLLGTVSAYVGSTLTLAAATTFPSTYSITASAAFTTAYQGIMVPPNPGFAAAGLTVTDLTTGHSLGTVATYKNYPILTDLVQFANHSWVIGATSVDMTPYTNAGNGGGGDNPIIPGMTIGDSNVGGGTVVLSTVGAYIGHTLTFATPAAYSSATGFDRLEFQTTGTQNVLGLTGNIAANSAGSNDTLGFVGASISNDPVTFSSGSNHVLIFTAPLSTSSAGANDVLAFIGASAPPPTVTAQAGFTTDYWGIAVPANPGPIVNGMSVVDQTTNQFLGTVASYGTVTNARQVVAWGMAGGEGTPVGIGETSADMTPYTNHFPTPIIPGMTIVDHDQSKTVGTVVSYIGNILTWTPAITFTADPGDEWLFSSGTQNVLGLNTFLDANSAGSSDLLSFIAPSGPPPAGTTPMSADDWCMFNFGSVLLINPQDGPIFQYDPTSGLSTAQLVPNAPVAAHGMFLAMPQQMVVAYGASVQGVQDPMLVAWSDAGNYNTWKLAVGNQAGTFRLSRGSMIVGGMQMPMQAMLWTDVGLWLMTYIGYPDVWGFSEIAQECGLIAKKAAGVLGSQVFWMGRDKFWTFTQGQVQPLPCEVWDAVFQNLNTDLLHLIRCGTDTAFDGVGWFYPSLATKQPGALQENDSFVKFNRVTGEWDYGTPIDVFGDGKTGGSLISDWIDANVYGNPISAMTDSTGTLSQLMWMDMGQDADGAPIDWWFRTGLFLLSEGEDFLFVDRCRPDFKWRKFSSPSTPSAQIKITLYAYEDSDNPAKPPSIYGPFTVADDSGPFDPRARGRYFSLKVEGNDLGSFARMGAVKFRFAPDGRAG